MAEETTTRPHVYVLPKRRLELVVPTQIQAELTVSWLALATLNARKWSLWTLSTPNRLQEKSANSTESCLAITASTTPPTGATLA